MGRDQSVCRVIVLGSTGSIGTQTLDVIAHLNALHERGAWSTRYDIVGLAAGRNQSLLGEQAARFRVSNVAQCSNATPHVAWCRETCTGPSTQTSVWDGEESAEQLIREVECDIVVAAISGIAGLPATLAAVELGRDVALANKETLVAAGAVVIPAAKKSGSHLLPVDSEHSGVWQCLAGRHEEAAPPFDVGDDVRRIVLTASGGPFRMWSKERIAAATVENALKHPTWSMGKKVSIDSATLMNKALEVVEAHWLFGIAGDRIGVSIHPQSIIHAMVEFADGSFVTQMGAPDMRTPIQYALTWPRRAEGCSKRMADLTRLDLEEPDLDRFPGLSLAYRALNEGGTSAAVMNAANEAAVAAFLSGTIAFSRIVDLTRRAMDMVTVRDVLSIDDVMRADREARAAVEQMI